MVPVCTKFVDTWLLNYLRNMTQCDKWWLTGYRKVRSWLPVL